VQSVGFPVRAQVKKKTAQPIAAAWGQPLCVHERLVGVDERRGSSPNSCAWNSDRASSLKKKIPARSQKVKKKKKKTRNHTHSIRHN
jgi:hypothetical protein